LVARVRFTSENGVQLLTSDVRRQLAEIVSQLESNAGVSVVVFEATGRTFIAGADINELKQLTPETAYSSSREGQRLMSRIEQLPATTIVAIHGACAGGGCELALACDFRIAAEGAVIGLPETRIGVIPGWGGTVRAVQVLGNMAARRMILSGELLRAEKALEIGLVDEVWPSDGFREAVDKRIASLLERGPNARARAKQLIQQFSRGANDAAFEAEARAFAACFETNEPLTGMNAFLEKTHPNWS
jgi:enoyl-CoA hydratase